MRRRWSLAVIGLVALSAQGRGYVVDGDADLVADEADDCPYTPTGTAVDAKGCPLQGDEDRDGVPDVVDACPYSPPRAQIDLDGCALDDDFDGVANGLDACPASELGARVDLRGCTFVARLPPPAVPSPLREKEVPALSPQPAPEPSAKQPDQEAPRPSPTVLEAPLPAAPASPESFSEAPQPMPELVPSVNAEPPGFLPTPSPEPDPGAGDVLEAPVAPPAAELISPPLLVEPAPEPPPQLPALLPDLPQPAPYQTAPLPVMPPLFVPPPSPVVEPAVVAEPLPPLPADAPRFSNPLFKTINFGLNRAELTDYSMSKFRHALPDLRKALELHPRMVVELAGHADPASESKRPDELGRERADILRAYLVAQGVDSARIIISSRGAREPLLTGEDSARNRRVEILTYPR